MNVNNMPGPGDPETWGGRTPFDDDEVCHKCDELLDDCTCEEERERYLHDEVDHCEHCNDQMSYDECLPRRPKPKLGSYKP